MSSFRDKLVKANDIYEDMTLLIDTCKNYRGDNLDPWGIYWDSFWELSVAFPFTVVWDDPDLGYQEDIMQRYLVIEDFMESFATTVMGVESFEGYSL